MGDMQATFVSPFIFLKFGKAGEGGPAAEKDLEKSFEAIQKANFIGGIARFARNF